jgi:superfamily II DNA or RNA helicase
MKKAIIEIKDEVNCKIHDLETSDRRALMRKFEYEVPGARYTPAVKLGRWSGKVSFFSLAGSTYVNLLEDVITYLYDNNYDIEIKDNRLIHETFEFDEVDEDTFSYATWPENHPAAGQPIKLRDYQVEIINNFLKNQQCIQEAATGAGKTIVTAALSSMVEKYGRTLVIVPNKSLVVQTEADYINLGLDVGVYFGERKEYNKTHTICTWQSINSLLKREGITQEEVDEFFEDIVCVMVDEVHQAKATVLKQILTDQLANVPIRWGLTGTIPKEKMDQVSLLVSIGEVIAKLTAAELQEKGVLAKCQVSILQLKDDKDFANYQSELKFLLENEDRMDKIVEIIEQLSQTGNTLVLVDRVTPGKTLVSKIPGAVFVSGETSLTERKEEYDDIATNDNKVLVATYGVAAVGINIPRVFHLVLIEPGKSFVRVIQSIGRGIRKAEDKDFVDIWDITSNCKFSKRHLTQRKQYYAEAEYPYTVKKIAY